MKKNILISLVVLLLCAFACSPLVSPEITDVDGNIYKTVKIGTQVWMAENLKTTKFNDWESIPNVTSKNEWSKLKAPGYCWYNNNAEHKNTYGGLYNWYAVNTGKLAPKGWHVPTDEDWETLMTFLGEYRFAGGKLKEVGLNNWQEPNLGATNETGFTALPGGLRNEYGTFEVIHISGHWWSSSEYINHLRNYAITYNMLFNDRRNIRSLELKEIGYSIRCLKD